MLTECILQRYAAFRCSQVIRTSWKQTTLWQRKVWFWRVSDMDPRIATVWCAWCSCGWNQEVCMRECITFSAKDDAVAVKAFSGLDFCLSARLHKKNPSYSNSLNICDSVWEQNYGYKWIVLSVNVRLSGKCWKIVRLWWGWGAAGFRCVHTLVYNNFMSIIVTAK